MSKGFEYIDHETFPMMEVRLNGTALSVRELVKIAEQMRVELLQHGVDIKIKGKADARP